MNYRRMGRTGLRISSVSLGGWLTLGGSVDEATSRAIVREALDGGVNFIDLADVYSRGESERVVGSAVADLDRTSLVLSTKVFGRMGEGPNQRGLSRKHVLESCEASLRRLGTDYVDLYFCHRPDPETPLEETVRAMDDLVHRGKVHYWGTSVWSAELLDATHDLCDRRGYYPPVVEQPEYSLLQRGIESTTLPAAQRLGMGLVVWSPLAGGLLTGKYDDGTVPAGSRAAETRWLDGRLDEPTRERLGAFSGLAAEVGATPAQLALAWILRQEGITSVITGATGPEHVRANLAAADLEVSMETARRTEEIFPA
ncbi:MAG: aldo/keto reductase family protein [Planctomycetota bacterium]